MDTNPYLAGFLFLSVLSCCYGQVTLMAKVNMTGIQGDVTFTQSAVGQITTVNFGLTGVSGSVDWELRESWVDFTVENKCGDDVIGPRVMNTIGGTLTAGTSNVQIQPTTLSDLKMLMGRSILLTKANERTCATLLKDTVSYATALVRLQGKINGEIWFRQATDERAEILANLFDASASTPTSYSWKIYTGSGSDCRTMSAIFDPTSTGAGACAPNNQAACRIGDLSGKLGELTVGPTIGSSRKFAHDTNLPMAGNNSVLGKYLVVINNSNQTTVCGMIKEVREKQAWAQMNKDGVLGQVSFRQKSPFDMTYVNLNLVGMGLAAGGYHVHLYPVPALIGTSDALCSAASVGGHWNPFNKPFPAAASATTPDQYEVGDLSGKFGSFENKDTAFGSYPDNNLPLFGQYSIVGRSFVIHKKLPGNPRWVCSNIDTIGDSSAAIATFKSKVIGTIIFGQSSDDPLGDTWVYGELNYADGTSVPSNQHMWMVHENMADMTGSGDACSSLGEMYNPFDAVKDGDYTSQCKSSNPYRCQVGDGTRQTDSLAIRTNEKSAKKFFFTTRNMPISGTGSIVGKSLSLHAANMGLPVLACTNIYHMRTRHAIVDQWSNDVKGHFKFSQKYSILNEPTQVTIRVRDMGSLAGKYHVHLFPVPKDSPNPCSDASVGGHYNPYEFDIALSPPPKTGTFDKYESGDLSGKHGVFNDMDSYNGSYSDNMLYLHGVRSIVGRSVVIHKMSDGSRWSCGTIREDLAMTGGTVHRAVAEFKDSVVNGHAVLTQYVYTDGTMSHTSVYLNFKYTDGRAKTMGHKINIGSKPVWGDRKSSSNRCSSTSGHFNPFTVNTQTGYDECSMYNPLRCSAGDVSGKQGTFDIGGMKMFVTDVNLPLYGKHSVIGRSLVIGSANGAAGNLACANIKPDGALMSTISYDSASKNTQLDMARKYATALQTNPWNIAVFGDDMKTSCGTYSVYFIGQDAKNLQTRFESMVKRGDQALGNFKQTTCAADNTRFSLLLFTLVFLFKKAML